jgi:predicted acetyltransferase
MAELVTPAVRYQRSFLQAMDEFVAEGAADSQTAGWIAAQAPDWQGVAAFEAFVEGVRRQSLPDEPRSAGFVPTTTLWWVDGEEYVGRIAIRHRLNDFLLRIGGHIGYDVRPTRRGAGQATAMLAATLPRAKALGVDPALITCDTTNVASRKVIEANGGELENEADGKLRFWVPTT